MSAVTGEESLREIRRNLDNLKSKIGGQTVALEHLLTSAKKDHDTYVEKEKKN